MGFSLSLPSTIWSTKIYFNKYDVWHDIKITNTGIIALEIDLLLAKFFFAFFIPLDIRCFPPLSGTAQGTGFVFMFIFTFELLWTAVRFSSICFSHIFLGLRIN